MLKKRIFILVSLMFLQLQGTDQPPSFSLGEDAVFREGTAFREGIPKRVKLAFLWERLAQYDTPRRRKILKGLGYGSGALGLIAGGAALYYGVELISAEYDLENDLLRHSPGETQGDRLLKTIAFLFVAPLVVGAFAVPMLLAGGISLGSFAASAISLYKGSELGRKRKYYGYLKTIVTNWGQCKIAFPEELHGLFDDIVKKYSEYMATSEETADNFLKEVVLDVIDAAKIFIREKAQKKGEA